MARMSPTTTVKVTAVRRPSVSVNTVALIAARAPGSTTSVCASSTIFRTIVRAMIMAADEARSSARIARRRRTARRMLAANASTVIATMRTIARFTVTTACWALSERLLAVGERLAGVDDELSESVREVTAERLLEFGSLCRRVTLGGELGDHHPVEESDVLHRLQPATDERQDVHGHLAVDDRDPIDQAVSLQ